MEEDADAAGAPEGVPGLPIGEPNAVPLTAWGGGDGEAELEVGQPLVEEIDGEGQDDADILSDADGDMDIMGLPSYDLPSPEGPYWLPNPLYFENVAINFGEGEW